MRGAEATEKGMRGGVRRGSDGGSAAAPPPAWPPLVVMAAAVLVYLNALPNGFAYDDLVIIRDNPLVHGLGDPASLWLTPYWPGSEALIRGLYRPLMTFLFSLQWALGGGGPLLFHAVSVVLHASVSLLVYRLVRGVVGWRGAAAGALLFAVHPVHTEAVANVVGQAELVSALLVLAAVVAYAERPEEGGTPPRTRALVALLFLGALLAKEHAIVLPALLVSVDAAQRRWQRRGWGGGVVRDHILLAAVAAMYLTVRWIVLGGTLSGEASSFLPFLQAPWTRLLTALSVWPEYLRLLLAPVQLSATYDPGVLPPPATVTPGVIGGAILMVGLVVGVLTPRAWPGVGWGGLWFLATILPVSNLVLPIGTVLAERTLYLPSAALSLWVGFAVSWAWEVPRKHRRLRAAVAGCLALLVVAFGVRTALRNPVWSGNEALFADMLEKHPGSFRANWFRALERVAQGDTAGSIPFWERAEEIYRDDPAFLVQLGTLRLGVGDVAGAEARAERALALSPEHPGALFLRGVVHVARGEAARGLDRVQALEALGLDALARQLADSLRAHSPGG